VAFIRHAKNPELPVVLLEDLGALAGLVIALAGVGLVEITDNADFDAFSTLTIGALLGVIAVILAIEMKSLLMGESASAVDTDLITAALERSPRVRRLIHLRTMHIGPEELLVAAKLELDDTLSFREVTDAIDETEALVRAAVPIARIIYLEPDVFDAVPAPEDPPPI
jgi:divalent metal cation (Fe/Co/Zn/Cd) transporter